jgi:uncharacterized surface protein with fasciclin (FAS1) repeats
MFSVKFFQLILIAGIFLFSACWKRSLAESSINSAPDLDDLEVWQEGEADPVEDQPSIWDITKRHGSFSTFSSLVEAAALEETFKSDRPMTVFAPTDEAFNQLPEGILSKLLEEDNKSLLIELLLNHVIPEVYLSIDLLDGESATTLSGYNLPISRDKEIKLGNATVTTADISASNGVVHVVDQVIIGEK